MLIEHLLISIGLCKLDKLVRQAPLRRTRLGVNRVMLPESWSDGPSDSERAGILLCSGNCRDRSKARLARHTHTSVYPSLPCLFLAHIRRDQRRSYLLPWIPSRRIVYAHVVVIDICTKNSSSSAFPHSAGDTVLKTWHTP